MNPNLISVDLVLHETRAEVHIRYQGFDLDMTPDEAMSVAELLVMCATMAKQGETNSTPRLH